MTTLTTTLHAVAARAGDGPWAHGGPPFPFFLIPIFWLVVIAAVIGFLVLGRRSREARAGRRAGERLLAERFADGSIDEEEYRARRAVLRDK